MGSDRFGNAEVISIDSDDDDLEVLRYLDSGSMTFLSRRSTRSTRSSLFHRPEAYPCKAHTTNPYKV